VRSSRLRLQGWSVTCCVRAQVSPVGVRTVRMASGSSTRRISVGSLLICRLAGVHRCRLPLGACPVLTALAHLRLRDAGDAGQPWPRSIWAWGVLSTRVGLWTVWPHLRLVRPRVCPWGAQQAAPSTARRDDIPRCYARDAPPPRPIGANLRDASVLSTKSAPTPRPAPAAAGKEVGGLTPLCPAGKAGNAPGGWGDGSRE